LPFPPERQFRCSAFSKRVLETEFSIVERRSETDAVARLAAAIERRTVLIGYGRVSTQDQSLDLQRDALTKAGCQKIFEDEISGTRAERPGLAKALEMLREGDTLAIWKLDRLGRSVKHLVDLVADLYEGGIQFKSLTDSIDTGTPSGRFFFHVMASLAEMERELTVERTRAGLEVARQLGRRGGRKRQMTDSKIESAKKLLASGIPPRDVAENLGVSIPTLYRWVPASGPAPAR
jgi:DNA invertase Pin-like site-specific DNA recombinase